MSHFIYEKGNHGLSEQEIRRAMLESPELKCGKGESFDEYSNLSVRQGYL